MNTIPSAGDLADPRRARRSRAVRRVFLSALALFVAAGALGLLGMRTGTRTASGDGQTLTVVYPHKTWILP